MAPAATAASKPKTASRAVTADVDLVRSYLRDIGRVPLLTHEQEITLGRQVQELMDLETLETELESNWCLERLLLDRVRRLFDALAVVLEHF